MSRSGEWLGKNSRIVSKQDVNLGMLESAAEKISRNIQSTPNSTSE